MNRIFGFIPAFLFLVSALNCAAVKVKPQPGPQKSSEKVLFTAVISGGGGILRAKGAVFFSHDNKVRMELTGPLGGVKLTAVYDGEKSVILFHESREFYEEEGFALSGKIAGIDINLPVFRSLFTGRISGNDSVETEFNRNGSLVFLSADSGLKANFSYKRNILNRVIADLSGKELLLKNLTYWELPMEKPGGAEQFTVDIPQGYTKLKE